LRALANLCCDNAAVVEQLVNQGMVDVLLKNTRLSAHDPYASQWALVCLRHVCKYSRRACEYIAGLQAQSVSFSDEDVQRLRDMGLRIELDENGRPRLIQPEDK